MRPTVAIVDSDAAALQTLRTLLEPLDVVVQSYDSAEDFLASSSRSNSHAIACLIAESLLPGMSGLQLLQHVRQYDRDLPVVLLAAEADVPMAVQAMRQGATDFIERPLWDIALLRRVSELLRGAKAARASHN
jgi:FixJ family two-component response regulator